MMSLKQLLNRRLRPIPSWSYVVFIVLPLLGFIDSVYLMIGRLFKFSLPCTLLGGCDVVTRSIYSSIGPIPLALLGVVYYLTLLLIAIHSLESGKTGVFNLYRKITWLGLVFSLWLIVVQAFILKAYCTYCLASAGICAILFVFTLVYIRVENK